MMTQIYTKLAKNIIMTFPGVLGKLQKENPKHRIK